MKDRDEYYLQVGEQGRARLDLLNKLYNASTQNFLLNSGLRKGMHVLELGCGPGEMSSWIAQKVGREGRVFATDQNEEQIALARECADARGIQNIEYGNYSTYELGEIGQSFDFIYGRWVFLHSKRPQDAIRVVYSKLKPGGILVLEDCVTSTAFCHPASEAFERFVQGWLEVSSIRGLDSAIGDKLCRLVFDAGGVLQHYAVFQPQLKTPEEKLLISMCMDESKQVHIDTNAMTEQLAHDLIAELKTLASDNNVIGFVRNVQVAAIKPA
jgi:ubiquinone/menaquinone biosynthesis C-methylase UbiE